MIHASKLIMKSHRCEAKWATGKRTRCTQRAKYLIDMTYCCTTHAKIRALEEILK
jgi:hypothetical protein